MKIYSFYTRSHAILKDAFTASLKDDYELAIECLDDLPTEKVKSDGVAHIGGGRNIWLYKTRKVIDAIVSNPGQVVLFADIDIKFFASFFCLSDTNSSCFSVVLPDFVVVKYNQYTHLLSPLPDTLRRAWCVIPPP